MANITILLIDYEPRSIDRLRQPLVSAGYKVEVATDGLTGMEAFHRLNPDMVLVEAMIPKKHGFEVCQELKKTQHGRRTPILITTGVYKGRKYRTQALHIYGCDEYIEKPIAPDQLLALVGKFLPERPSAPAKPAPATSPASASSQPRRAPTPIVVGSDFTEDEIMARLNAILPDTAGSPERSFEVSSPSPDITAEAIEPPDENYDANPFLQMQTELTEELGALAAALALEAPPVFEAEPAPVPIPSDQASSPPLIETLPLTSPVEQPIEPATRPANDFQPVRIEIPEPPAESPAADPHDQVVNFDSKRSKRRSKKAGRNGTPSPVARVVEDALGLPPVAARAEAVGAAGSQTQPASSTIVWAAAREQRIEATLPAAATARSQPEQAPRRGLPLWLWVIAMIGTLIGIYFGFFYGAARASNPPADPVGLVYSSAPRRENPRPVPEAEPQAPPAETPAVLPVSETSAPVLAGATSTPTVAAPQKTHASSDATGPAAPEKNPPKPTVTQARRRPATVGARGIGGAAPVPVAEPAGEVVAPPDTTPPLHAAPTEVPAAPSNPVGPPAAGVVAGTLVPLAEVDTPPVTLIRRLPDTSMQARRMRVQGNVTVRLLINERGTVDEVVIVSGAAASDLNDSAATAARQWTYRPATKGGVPVSVWKTESLDFKL